MGRNCIDPEIKKQNQKEARRRWKINNAEYNKELSLKSMRKRYSNDPEYREQCLKKSKEQYLFKKEASLLRSI
ncbi:MAG TPA: hypothetical protein DEG69_07590, partial [Flavobacteriaceae bacterium]|nr:hypothetical protein [Flavobacteriaceae bacterium]